MDSPLFEHMKKKAKRAEQYASFSQTHGGLGNILGGGVFIAVHFVTWYIKPGIVFATLIFSLAAIYLIGKEVIRKTVYLRFGNPREIWSKGVTFCHTGMIISFAILALTGWLTRILKGTITLQQLILLLLLTGIPVIIWRCMRSLVDFIAGFLLLDACLFAASGQQLSFMVQYPLAFPLIGLGLAVIGFFEHREYGEYLKQSNGVQNVYS
jgi:hypothetical protein